MLFAIAMSMAHLAFPPLSKSKTAFSSLCQDSRNFAANMHSYLDPHPLAIL